jgi:CBS domain-containing protein
MYPGTSNPCARKHKGETMLVSQVMRTPVVTISPEATLREAAECMLEHGVNGLPVVDATQYVVGIIGLKDILRAPIPSLANSRVSRLTRIDELARHLENTRVGRVMATTVWSVKENEDLMRAIAIMVNEGLHPLPVLRDGRLVGVVSRADAVRAVLASQPTGVVAEE